MKKWILRILLVILIAVGIVGGIFIYNGHQLYKDALNTISLSDKVDKKKITDIFTANISYEERKKQSLKYSNFFDGKGMDRVIRIIVSTY